MIGMQYNSNSLQGKSVLEVSRFGSAISSPDLPEFKKNGGCPRNEPVSVLDTRSPSPSTSTSASSSSLGGGYKAASLVAPSQTTAVKEGNPVFLAAGRKDKCVGELHPAPLVSEWSEVPEKFDLGLEDWECLLTESGAGSDQYLLRWISGDVDDPSLNLKQLLQGGNPNEIQSNVGFGASDQNCGLISCSDNYNGNNFPPSNLATLASALSVQELQHEQQKPQIFNPSVLSELQNVVTPNVFTAPLYGIQPPLKRQNLGNAVVSSSGSQVPPGVFVNPSNGLLAQIGSDRPPDITTPCGNDSQVVYDHVYKAAELILTGQFSHAQMILARLNHHHLSPGAKPLQRATFYFKEALSATSLPPKIPTPVDGVLKMGAYKAFSEVSPLIQFMNFTSNQAILEAVDGAEFIHIFDFDIAFGAQWSSFMQELPRRNRRAPSLKITAFASPSTHHPIEINLMYENLTQFANDVGIKFELEVVNFDSFDPSSYPVSSFRSSESEVIAVNFPIWSVLSYRATFPLLMHYIRQLSPKIVVSLDRGFERTELPFPHHLVNALEYFEVLFESIDAANVTSDASNKIERFLFQPSIESVVFGHIRFPDQMPPWRNLFASAGFLPMPFSNFAETQGECVAKRTQVRGFHVEKRHTSLALCWQNRELLSAMAWRC